MCMPAANYVVPGRRRVVAFVTAESPATRTGPPDPELSRVSAIRVAAVSRGGAALSVRQHARSIRLSRVRVSRDVALGGYDPAVVVSPGGLHRPLNGRHASVIGPSASSSNTSKWVLCPLRLHLRRVQHFYVWTILQRCRSSRWREPRTEPRKAGFDGHSDKQRKTARGMASAASRRLGSLGLQ